MWQRFTERSRKVIFYAQEEAQRFGSGYISTEHLLLGLLRESDNVANRVLAKLRVESDRVLQEVQRQIAHSEPSPIQDLTLTPRAKRVIDLAYDEARNLNNNYIGTEHILLGLLREGEGVGGKVLAHLGAELEAARKAAMELQDQERSQTPAEPSEAQFRRNPSLSSALLAIRQRLVGPDLLALMLLAEPTDSLVAGLKNLNLSEASVATAIETEILRNPPSYLAPECTIDGLWSGEKRSAESLFAAIASHPASFTRKAMDALGISQEQIVSVFSGEETGA